MKPIGVLRFLGTNCDADVMFALESLNIPHQYIWWADRFNDDDYSGYVLPGGFSYGDYLRAGALAARSPAMEDLKKGATKGKPILGICNGFQILTEAGLLPGALTKNLSRQFQDEWVELDQVRQDCKWSSQSRKLLKLPIAHSMGRFYAPEDVLKLIQDSNMVWLRYKQNPNGSLSNIAGLCTRDGKIAALMPHPERALATWMGSGDGAGVFEQLRNA